VSSEGSASSAEIKVLAASSQIVGSSKVTGRRREFWSLGVPPRPVIIVSTITSFFTVGGGDGLNGLIIPGVCLDYGEVVGEEGADHAGLGEEEEKEGG
jgi:hypothetical protein